MSSIIFKKIMTHDASHVSTCIY